MSRYGTNHHFYRQRKLLEGGGTVLTASTPIYSPSHVVTGGWAATEDNLHMLFWTFCQYLISRDTDKLWTTNKNHDS